MTQQYIEAWRSDGTVARMPIPVNPRSLVGGCGVVTVWECVGVVSDYFKIPREKLCINGRLRKFATERQIVYSLAYQMTNKSTSVIGREMHRDRTCIRKGLKNVSKRISESEHFRLEYDQLVADLGGIIVRDFPVEDNIEPKVKFR